MINSLNLLLCLVLFDLVLKCFFNPGSIHVNRFVTTSFFQLFDLIIAVQINFCLL